MITIHIHPDVQAIRKLHRKVINRKDTYKSVWELLDAFAENLETGYRFEVPAAFTEISNYHPQFLGKPKQEIIKIALEQTDFHHTIANEYGFKNWRTLLELNPQIDFTFEKSVDALLTGDIHQLKNLLDEYPQLITQQSSFGHRATLLHYVGSNGVELWRQVVPSNLVEMTKLLLERGANPNQTAQIYGQSTIIELIASSAHPLDAGIQKDLLKLF